MRARLLQSATLAALLAALLPSGAPAIIGGELDGNRHPMVGFMIGYDEEGDAFYGCSATLVSPTVMVSAAHCLGGDVTLVPASVRVTFGPQVPLDADGFPAPTVTIGGTPYPNPKFFEEGDNLFDMAQISEDYGVIVLDRPASDLFPSVVPAALPTAGLIDALLKSKKKPSFEVVGYGITGEFKLKSGASFDGYRRVAVMDANGSSLNDPSALALKANVNGSSSTDGMTCSGDSGGGVLLGTRLVAVNSASDFCHHKSYGARLDTAEALEFLAGFLD
jgi:hypothetical protein